MNKFADCHVKFYTATLCAIKYFNGIRIRMYKFSLKNTACSRFTRYRNRYGVDTLNVSRRNTLAAIRRSLRRNEERIRSSKRRAICKIRRQPVFVSEVYPDTCTRALSKTCRYRQCVFFLPFDRRRFGNKRRDAILRQTESWRHFKTMIMIILFYSVARSTGPRTADAFLSRLSIYENRFVYLVFFVFNVFVPRGPRGNFDNSPWRPVKTRAIHLYSDNSTRFYWCGPSVCQWKKTTKSVYSGPDRT